jgi:hypothetical protein
LTTDWGCVYCQWVPFQLEHMDHHADWLARRKYIEADPEQQRLSQAHQELCAQINKLNSELRAGTYTLQRLLIARDCVQHFAGEVECTNPGEDEQLEQWTANHGEAWLGMFNGACDDLTEAVLGLCATLTADRDKRFALKDERDIAWGEVKAREEFLGTQYNVAKSTGTP